MPLSMPVSTSFQLNPARKPITAATKTPSNMGTWASVSYRKIARLIKTINPTIDSNASHRYGSRFSRLVSMIFLPLILGYVEWHSLQVLFDQHHGDIGQLGYFFCNRAEDHFLDRRSHTHDDEIDPLGFYIA
jgi:hypothetical protein